MTNQHALFSNHRQLRWSAIIGIAVCLLIGASLLVRSHVFGRSSAPATTDQKESAVKPKPLRTPFLWREDVLTIFTTAHERQLLIQDGLYHTIEWYLSGREIPYTSFADHSNVPFAMETIGDRRGLEGRLYKFRCWQQQHNPHAIRCEYLNHSDNPEATQYGYNTWRPIPIKDKPTE